MSGRVGEEVASEVLAHGRLRQLGQILLQLRLRVAPGEVRIALAKAELGELLHHLGPRKRLGQEDGVGIDALNLADEPFPEGERLGVRIVDPEHAHAALGPQQYDVAQCGPQVLPVGRAEVERVDVLVFLGRIFGVLYAAVRAVVEPIRVLVDPRMVGRAIDGEVHRQLQAEFARLLLKVQKIVERAELGGDRLVAAAHAADGVRAAGVVRAGDEAVVRPLALGRPDRVDGRHVQRVEAHRGNRRQARFRFAERRAAGRVGPLRTREDLVPGREARGRSIDDQAAVRADSAWRRCDRASGP